MTPPLWQKVKRNSKASWWKWKWLKAQHSENEDHGIWPHHFIGNKWGNSGNSVRLFLGGSKITADGDCSHEMKRRLLLGRKVMTNQVQFSSVTQSCPTLCDPMNLSTAGLPVHHQLPEFTQTHIHRVNDAIQPSHPLSSPSPPAPIPPSNRVFSNESTLRMRWPKYWSFTFSIIPSKEIPFSPSEWTGWISLQSKGLSRVFSNTTVQKHQFFGAQLSSQSNSRIHTWPLEKP